MFLPLAGGLNMNVETALDIVTKRRPNADEPGMIDLRHLGAVLRRRWQVIVAVSALVLVLTFIAYKLAKPIYSATAQVALDRRDDELASTAKGAALVTDSPSVDTEVEVLRSPALAASVVDKLGLGRDPEFAGTNAPTPALARERAINALLGRVDIKRTGLSYAIGVGILSGSAGKSARIVNEMVDGYVASQLGGKESERKREVSLLSGRLGQLRSEVIAAEAAVAAYRGAHNLVNVNAEGTSSAQESAALNGQLAQAQAEQAAAQARLSTARAQLARGGGGESLGAALNSDVVQQLRAQQAVVSSERAALVGRYGPRHPDLAKTDRQLADIDSRIQAEVNRIVANLETEARVASGRTGSLQSSINRSEGALTAENSASVRLNELERNAESTRSLYQAFLDQYRGAVARQGTDQSTAHVIAHAIPPLVPVSPNSMVFTILGVIAALLASGLAVALLQFLENGLTTSEAVERKLGLPALGSVPDIASIPNSGVSRRDPVAPAEFLVANPSSVFTEAFRGLRTALKRGPGGDLVRVVAVTSALPAEGKTTTAICLARSAGLAGQRVVLVDCDLRQRASSRTLTRAVEHGLVEVLTGKARLEQALITDTASGAVLLPQSASSENHFDLMESAEMQQLVEQLRAQFELVILDCAPILPVAEARQAAAIADRTVLAVHWSKTPVRAVEHALDHLDRVGARVAGIVLTRADLRELSRSGYGDQAYYYKSFKNYYA